MCVCTCVCAYACVYARVYACIMCVCVCDSSACMRVYVYVCMCAVDSTRAFEVGLQRHALTHALTNSLSHSRTHCHSSIVQICQGIHTLTLTLTLTPPSPSGTGHRTRDLFDEMIPSIVCVGQFRPITYLGCSNISIAMHNRLRSPPCDR